MTALRATLVAILAAAATPAAAFVQTCVGTPKLCLKWPTPSITWKINPSQPNAAPSCQPGDASGPAIDVAKASFATWQGATHPGDTAACTNLSFTYGGVTSSIKAGADTSEHVVLFRQGWCSQNPSAVSDPCFQAVPPTCGNKYGCFDDEGGAGRSTLALTSVSYNATNGTILDSDTEIVDWNGGTGAIDTNVTNGIYVTCYTSAAPAATCSSYGQADCVYYDLQNTLTHEIGHFIGLAHPCEPSKGIACTAAMADVTMYPYEQPVETKKRTLSPDDVDGVCTLYPAGSTSGSGGGGPSSSHGGCATGPGFAGTTLLALLALGLRRRRR
ncbi:matrixin family metalloprotease [Anaeromyxobacter oryzae]|uniref:Peptidase M10 metallopeptidase domain-containing protein n=1 Tax=Anaeromyxobacter oryzae TaxID=2918170 RepID=A0ABM7WQX9_9BACT|nr:matrixin family metalloprotease [Anaeromyxobacter oryzae]BDG01878.1 hypothetical protein AMOR_08740 [Anaeromyxobacter oryzae]